jgi:hypothetical protein
MSSLLTFIGENSKAILFLAGAYVIYNGAAKLKAFYDGVMASRSVLLTLSAKSNAAAFLAQIAVLKLNVGVTVAAAAAKKGFAASLMLVGKAALFAFAKFALLALVLYGLYKIVTRKSSPKFYLLFGVMAIGVLALGFALKFVKGKALAAAIVLALLAAAVSLIFYGISAMIDKFTELIQTLVTSVAVLPLMAAGLYGVAGGLIAVGAAGMMSVAGIVSATAALAAMMLVMKAGGMDLGDVSSAAADVMNMGSGMEKLASGMGQIKSMAAEISNIGGEGFLAINSDGGKTNAVIGSGEIMENFVDGKMTVDVKMPEISMPEITVIVNVDKDGGVSVEKKIASA